MASLHSRSSKEGGPEARGPRPGRAGPLQVERLEDRMMLSGSTAPTTIVAKLGPPDPLAQTAIVAQSFPATIPDQAIPTGGILFGGNWASRIDAHRDEGEAGAFMAGSFAPHIDSAVALAVVKEIVSASTSTNVGNAMWGTSAPNSAPAVLAGNFAPPINPPAVLAGVKEIVSSYRIASIGNDMSGSSAPIGAPAVLAGVKGLDNRHSFIDTGRNAVGDMGLPPNMPALIAWAKGSLGSSGASAGVKGLNTFHSFMDTGRNLAGDVGLPPDMPVLIAWAKGILSSSDFMNMERFRPGLEKGFGNGFGNGYRDFIPGLGTIFSVEDILAPPSILSWPELSASMGTASESSNGGGSGLSQLSAVGSGVASKPGSVADAAGTSDLEEVPPGVDLPESIALAQAILGGLLAEPSAQSLPVLVGLRQITELLPLRESSLDLTATLLTFFTDAKAERTGLGALGGGKTTTATPFDAPPWARFVVGLDEAFEERRLAAHEEVATDADPISQEGSRTSEGAIVDEAIRCLELEGGWPSQLDGSPDSVPVGDEEPPLDDVAAAVSVPLAAFPALMAGRVYPRRARRRERLEAGEPDMD